MHQTKKNILFIALATLGSNAFAVAASGQYCTGTIKEILKWSSHDKMSILLSGSKRYFQLPGKIEESIALTAYATGKPITINWSASYPITDCVNDWGHYTVLNGFMKVVD